MLTREDVERLIADLNLAIEEGAGSLADGCRAALLALLTRAETAERERDAARAAVEVDEGLRVTADICFDRVVAERDAARAALRKIAGISNECTWTKGARHLAGELQDIIRSALAAAPDAELAEDVSKMGRE